MTRASSSDRGYDSKWHKARKEYLKVYPHCVKCADRGQHVVATVVDHIIPHKKDWSLFWDRKNWQPLCKPHHDSLKQREDNCGYMIGCDIAGRPIDPNHPWNKNKT